MYYPYFRCKQFELIALREMATQIAAGPIIPILEPVKENHSGLQKCIGELKKAAVPFILVVNPKYGDFKNDNRILIEEIVDKELKGYTNFQIGYIVNNDSELFDVVSFLKAFSKNKIALIHYGYPDGEALAKTLKEKSVTITTHVFIGKKCGRVYRKHFQGDAVLVGDGFNKIKNADYPEDEPFSELHLTYKDDGFKGFGDFLIVGDDYSESGGPAYAVAIHITYQGKDKTININHFVSVSNSSPVDPAGKFAEAVEKLNNKMGDDGCLILETAAIKEFLALYLKGHFPGLGSVKKLSMQHHLELMLHVLK